MHAHRRGRHRLARVAPAGCRAATSRSCTLDGNTIYDSHGRVSRVTTAGYGPSVGKQILMAYLPRAMAVAGHRPAGDVHERAVPREGRRHRRPVRPRRHPAEGLTHRCHTSAFGLDDSAKPGPRTSNLERDAHSGLREAGAGARGEDQHHRRRPVGRHHQPRVHDVAARGVRGRAGRAAGRAARRRVARADARGRRGRRAVPVRRVDRREQGDARGGRLDGLGSAAHRYGADRGDPGDRGRRTARST